MTHFEVKIHGLVLAISQTERKDYQDNTEVKEKLGKIGVMNMTLMKNAEARERETNKGAIDKLIALKCGEIIWRWSSTIW